MAWFKIIDTGELTQHQRLHVFCLLAHKDVKTFNRGKYLIAYIQRLDPRFNKQEWTETDKSFEELKELSLEALRRLS